MKKLLTIFLSCFVFGFLIIISNAKETEPTVPVISLEKIYVANPDSNPLEVLQNDGVITHPVEPNSTVYFVIKNADRSEDLAKLRVMDGDYQQGSEFVGEPTLEYITLYDSTGKSIGYSYVAALPVLGLAGETEADVTGKITVSDRWSGSERFKFRFLIADSLQKEVENYTCTGRSCFIDFEESEKTALINFYDIARFEITLSKQGKIDVGFSSQALTDIAYAYSEQELRFYSWEASPIFNKEGKLYIYAQEGEFLYEVAPAGLVNLSETYSVEDSAFVLQTRRLAAYVVATEELGEFVAPEPRHNPLTGGA